MRRVLPTTLTKSGFRPHRDSRRRRKPFASHCRSISLSLLPSSRHRTYGFRCVRDRPHLSNAATTDPTVGRPSGLRRWGKECVIAGGSRCGLTDLASLPAVITSSKERLYNHGNQQVRDEGLPTWRASRSQTPQPEFYPRYRRDCIASRRLPATRTSTQRHASYQPRSSRCSRCRSALDYAGLSIGDGTAIRFGEEDHEPDVGFKRR
jgi:hypothetical protein